MKNTTLAIIVAGLIGISSPSAAMAQSDWSFEIAPRVGYLLTAGDLIENFARVGNQARIQSATIGDGPVAGLVVELRNEDLGIGFRTFVDRTIGSSTEVLAWEACVSGCVAVVPTPPPSDQLSTAVTELGFEVLLPTLFTFGRVEPYASVGVGLRHYDFGDAPADRPTWSTYPQGGTARDLLVGGGFKIDLGDREVDLFAFDAISEFRGETAHHVRVGFAVPLGL